MLFCPSVNILYFALFFDVLFVTDNIIIELGFNNSK